MQIDETMANCLLLKIIILNLFVSYLNAEIVILYNSTADHIELLNEETFDGVIFNSEKASIVEFFAHWCGRCKRWAHR